MKLRILFATLFISTSVFAQTEVNQLKARLKEDISDKERIESLLHIGFYYEENMPDSAEVFYIRALVLANKTNDSKSKCESVLALSKVLRRSGRFLEAQSRLEMVERLAVTPELKADWNLEMAELSFHLQRRSEAFDYFVAAQEADPAKTDEHMQLQWALLCNRPGANDSLEFVKLSHHLGDLSAALEQNLSEKNNREKLMVNGLRLWYSHLNDSAAKILYPAYTASLQYGDSLNAIRSLLTLVSIEASIPKCDSLEMHEDSLMRMGDQAALSLRAMMYSTLGYIYKEKYPQKATEFFSRALSISEGYEALALMHQLLDLAKKSGNQEEINHFTEGILNWTKQLHEDEIAQLLKSNAVLEGELSRLTVLHGNDSEDNAEWKKYLPYGVAAVGLLLAMVFIFTMMKANKHRRQMEEEIGKVNEEKNALQSLSNTQIDAAKQKDGEAKKRESELGKLRALVEQQETEMRRISNEVTTGVGGALANAKASLDQLAREAGNGLPVERFMQLQNAITKATKEVRSVTEGLLPDELENKGMVEAVKGLCNEMNGRDLSVQFELAGHPFTFERVQEIAIYRIIREILHNTAKHADAAQAEVRFQFLDRELLITTRDNGRGFEVNQSISKGSGLKGIIARVTFLKGDLDIESSAQKGTVYSIKIKR